VLFLINIGTQSIHTERLLLRRFTVADASAAYHNWQNDPVVTRYLTWPAYTSLAPAKARMTLTAASYRQPDVYQWAMQLTDPAATLIGNISVVSHDDDLRTMAIGYVMGQTWWGHGYMPEALRAVIDYLFSGTDVNRIEARHDTHNPNSGKVMHKAGMQFEGVLRQRGLNNTGLCDEAFYAILRSDWTEKHRQND
jgi:RimJ/RimL family protein N-acetyltransferase